MHTCFIYKNAFKNFKHLKCVLRTSSGLSLSLLFWNSIFENALQFSKYLPFENYYVYCMNFLAWFLFILDQIYKVMEVEAERLLLCKIVTIFSNLAALMKSSHVEHAERFLSQDRSSSCTILISRYISPWLYTATIESLMRTYVVCVYVCMYV